MTRNMLAQAYWSGSGRTGPAAVTGTRTGMLGYLARGGRPLVAPVWLVVDGGELVFNTGRNTAKGPALQRDSRVVLTVYDSHPPFSFVQVQGVAELVEDPAALAS